MLSELSEIVKSKKAELQSFLIAFWNHPHRLSEVSLTGTYTTIVDERSFTGAGLSASVETATLTGSLFTTTTRKLAEKTPFKASLSEISLAQGEIAMMHNALIPWEVFQATGTVNSDVTVGSLVVDDYTRPNTSSPWTLVSSNTFDIDGHFEIGIIDGGDEISGGRGADVDSSRCSISIAISAGVYSFTVEFFRFPWDDPWSSETTAFSDNLSDWITAGNAANGGGYSGSSSLEAVFT